MNLKRAERKAYWLLDEMNISAPSVPVEKIAEDLNIKLVYEKLEKDLSGFLFKDDTSEESFIFINEGHSINRKRFTIAHELGHYLLHSDKQDEAHIDRGFTINFRSPLSSKAVNPKEIEANAFAAALLMPEELIIEEIQKKIKDGIDLVESIELKEIAKKFEVSEQALCFRLGKLGYL